MKHSSAMVNELNAAKRLILTHFEFVVDFLMHISGLVQRIIYLKINICRLWESDGEIYL